MAHIVYITNGLASTLNSSFELSRRLVEAGHRVTYVSHEDVGGPVEAQGYPFHRLSRDREIKAQADAEQRPGRGRRIPPVRPTIDWILRRRRFRLQSAAQTEVEDLVRSLEADLLILDIEMHVAVIAAATLGIPVVLVMVWFSIFRDPRLPPMHTALMPGDGWKHRTAIRLAWARTRAERIRLEWRRRLRPGAWRRWLRLISYGTMRIEDLQAVARARAFDLSRQADRTHWLRPCLYPELPTLSFNLWEMEFPHARPPNLRYVGPMVARNRSEVWREESPNGAWERLKAERTAAGRVRGPLVYCSLGSFWSADRPFLRHIVGVFERRPEWQLVIGLGGQLRPEDLAPVPENVVCLEWAPQLEILAQADCAITHGGITTINECVAFAVPMVVYSTKHVDQNGCAARVAFHGLGVVGDKDADSRQDMEDKIQTALTDPSIRRKVSSMRDRLMAYEQSGVAVRTIEEILAYGGRLP